MKPEKIQTKTVTEVQERVRVDTKIVERPDGTKETVITEVRDTESKKSEKRVETKVQKDWMIGVGMDLFDLDPIYSLTVQRRIFLDLYAGGYYRTDGTLGLSVSYSF